MTTSAASPAACYTLPLLPEETASLTACVRRSKRRAPPPHTAPRPSPFMPSPLPTPYPQVEPHLRPNVCSARRGASSFLAPLRPPLLHPPQKNPHSGPPVCAMLAEPCPTTPHPPSPLTLPHPSPSLTPHPSPPLFTPPPQPNGTASLTVCVRCSQTPALPLLAVLSISALPSSSPFSPPLHPPPFHTLSAPHRWNRIPDRLCAVLAEAFMQRGKIVAALSRPKSFRAQV